MTTEPADLNPLRGVDRSNVVPLYYQLQEILKEEIEHGRWQPGELLPSEAELEASVGVSRTVIRQALDILEGDGQVYRVKGKGTVVAEPKVHYDVVAAAASWEPPSPGRAELSRVIHVQQVAVGGHVGRLLDLAAGDHVFELTLVHSVEGSPGSLTQMFLRRDGDPTLAKVDVPALEEGGPDVYTQLRQRYGLRVVESHWSIEATRTDQFEAEQLQITAGTPIFLLTALDFRTGDRPAAFTRGVVRSDHFHFSAVIRHGERPPGVPLGKSLPASRSWEGLDPAGVQG